MGPVRVLKKNDYQVKRRKIENVEVEIAALKIAIERSKHQLRRLYEKAVKEVGEASAAIFEVHEMMLEDEDYIEAIENMIKTEMVNAEFAVAVTGDNFSQTFANMEDDYMRARAADIKDVSERLVRNLGGNKVVKQEENPVSLADAEADFADVPVIIVAEDLTPSETVQLDKEKILAFVTIHGSANSHTAILARMMSIPALIGVPIDLKEIENGVLAVVDGIKGEMIIEPDESTKEKTLKKLEEEKEKVLLLEEQKGKEDITLSGQKINVYANIGSVADIGYALQNDASGIGLFRSEFLYMGRNDFPTEVEQYQVYKQAAQMMGDKPVIIRTMDIGADKQVDYMGLTGEENPAMGYRAIRICLKETEIFKTQLRALFQAAVYGNISVMYPMITSVEEVRAIYDVVEEVKKELETQKIQYRIPEQGIMVETPAAALISDELAQLVDFFSIGTNDLTQYTLAIDRQNEKLDDFYDSHHPAVLKLIKLIVYNAHKYGKWAGICGELGADLTLTKEFLQMGVDELSVAPGEVLKVRKVVRETK